jgi:phage shock protein A
MLKILTTLVRGAAAEAGEAAFDANATRILAQQLRDAHSALELARRELAFAMGHRTQEQRAHDQLVARNAELEQATVEAMNAGREDLAQEAAAQIAANEDDLKRRKTAIERLDVDIAKLKRRQDDGERRLEALKRGLEISRAQEALRRAGAHGDKAMTLGTGALKEAEATLARIQTIHQKETDARAALDELEDAAKSDTIDAKLANAGFGANRKTDPADILARLKAKSNVNAKPNA